MSRMSNQASSMLLVLTTHSEL